LNKIKYEERVDAMVAVGYLEVKLTASWVKSLKEKRMIVRSMKAKIHNKFNVSVHEVAENDNHQLIVLGITTASNATPKIEAVFEQVVNYIESNYDTSIQEINTEIF
jgi:uncharacterized protein YlxP (DUF503 family)